MKLALHRLALVMLALVPAVPAAKGQEVARALDAVDAYERGLELLKEEKYTESLAELQKALQIEPTYDEAFVAVGDAYLGMEEYEAARDAFTHAINLNPNIPAAHNGRGEAFLEIEPVQVELALTDFRAAMEMERNNPRILSNLGHVMVKYAQDPVSGIRLLDEAIAGNDADARAYRDRGLAQAMLKEFDKAEADLKKAAEIDPTDHENFMTLSNVYSFQEEYDKSIEALTSAIATYKPEKLTDPKTYISAYLLRCDTWLALGKETKDEAKRKTAFEHVVEDANAVLDEYEDRFPESGYALYRRGIAQRMLGEYAKSIDSLTRAIQVVPPGQEAPYLAEAYLRRGIDWFYQGNIDLARGDFEQAASTGDGYRDPRIYLWIGYTYFKNDDLRTAIDYYGEAIAKDPEFTLAHVNRGLAYMELEEFNKALTSFNNAIRSEPNVGEHYFRAGRAYMAMEKYREAADMFSLASLKDEDNPKFRKAAAAALKKMGKTSLGDRWESEAEKLLQE